MNLLENSSSLKIDVVISKDQHRPLEQSVIKHGGTPQCYLPKTEISD